MHPQTNYRNDDGNENYDRHSHGHTYSRNESRRCNYCAEYNHSTNECGFRKPVLCRQCGAPGYKQKFCVDFTRR